MKILVADDDTFYLKVLNDVLGGAGHEVIVATDGKEALRKAIKELPDMIILDVILPSMLGTEICENLRKFKGTAEIPILMISAGAAEIEQDESSLDEYLVDGFIKKPVNNWELLKVINSFEGFKSKHARVESTQGAGIDQSDDE
jgi:DNA-binding response OmpR family regulator